MAVSKKKNIEAILAFQLRAFKIDFKTQFRFHPERQWRFDFCFPTHMLAVEVQGLSAPRYSKKGKLQLGGHQSIDGIKKDLEKYDEAMRLGWKVYCCEQGMVESGRALKTIEVLLGLVEMPQGKQKQLPL